MKFIQGMMLFVIIACISSNVFARSLHKKNRKEAEHIAAASEFKPYSSDSSDLVAAATGHHHGRVQIKVYRGPDTHGDHHEHFAPHGYWVKQPADADHHH